MGKTPEVLSMEDLADLKGLATDLRALRKRWQVLVARFGRARRASFRASAGDRLLCISHDCLAPALRDVVAIERDALEQARKRDPP